MSELGKQLVVLERELGRCVEDAERHRRQLIALSSFDDAAGLSRLEELDISLALSSLMMCRKRAIELLAKQKKLSTA